MNVYRAIQLRRISSSICFSNAKTISYKPNQKKVSKGYVKHMKNAYNVTSARELPFSNEPDFDYLLVLDFEATCDKGARIMPVQEIIEMPVIALETKTWKEKARFHQYISPTERPILTSFCSELTGIIQEMVENRPQINQTLAMFHEWLERENISTSNFAFVTCGDWDLKVALTDEAAYKGFALEEYFSKWINIKKCHSHHTGHYCKGIMDLLRYYNITHTGRLHSGIDDVQNITAIVKALAQQNYKFRINGSIGNLEKAHRLFKNNTKV